MDLTNNGYLQCWQFEIFSDFDNFSHFITDKHSFVKNIPASPDFRNSNPRLHDNLDRLAGSLGIPGNSIYLSHQTHSANIMKVEKGMNNTGIQDIDAFISNSREVCLVVKTADCVPILLYDPVKKVIAAVHAGWRGSVKKILTGTIKAMQNHFRSNPSDIVAAIGPSICPACYEVGQDVLDKVKAAFPFWQSLVRYNGPRVYLNLAEANRQQLLNAGLQEKNIETTDLCTFEQSDYFYSARKEGPSTGRILSGIWMK